MKRFFGMMPNDEIKMSKNYRDKNGLLIRIDAGPHGWTITYADCSTKYADVDATTEENFAAAYNIITEELGKLTEDHGRSINSCIGEI